MQNRKKKKTQIYRTVFWTLWEKARVGCFKRTASKHVYYLGWNGSPAQVGCMRQVLGPGAMGKPRGSGCGGRWEGGSGWGTHVNPWLFHFNVWQNPLQIKIKKKKTNNLCPLQWKHEVLATGPGGKSLELYTLNDCIVSKLYLSKAVLYMYIYLFLFYFLYYESIAHLQKIWKIQSKV